MFSILHRMIFRDLLRVFALSLLALTGILLVAGIVAEASQQGLKPLQVLAAIPLLIPSTLPYTIPTTTLFAVCSVYGRLSADNEILALRASGTSAFTVVWPGVILGLAASAATFGLYYRLIPSTHLLLRAAVIHDVEDVLYTALDQHHQMVLPHSDYSIYVEDVQGRRLINMTIKRKDRNKETDLVTVAHEAELHADVERRLILVDMRNGAVWGNDGTRVRFERHRFDMPLPEDLVDGPERRPRDMSWHELFGYEEAWEARMAGMSEDIGQSSSLLDSGRGPRDLRTHISHLRNKIKQLRKQVLGIEAEVHMRPALALGCLCFVLIGCPIGIWMGRGDFLSAFLICFLPVILVYYPLVLCGTGLAKGGHIAPGVSVWLGDVAAALAGVWLFRRLARN